MPRDEAMQSNTATEPKPPTIVVTGGGSGGHITPLLAVAQELKHQQPRTRIVYIGERGGILSDIAEGHSTVDESYQIFAGKLRRYHSEGLKQLLDIPTMLKNLRDIVFVFLGFWQAMWRLMHIKPAAIFVKGGFVCVPVGLAAALLRIPYVTHDSDAIPGLANRIVSRWAAAHAVAMPVELYPYPPDKTVQVGIPIDASFMSVTDELKRQYRAELGITHAEQVIFVIGGGLGAVRLNDAVTTIAGQLLQVFPHLYILHGVGRGNEQATQANYDLLSENLRRRVIVKGFIKDLYRHSGAADVVITRGSATSLAEFAAQGKACIVVPNPFLTGGHQLKNADHLEKSGAVLVVAEDEIKQNAAALYPEVIGLLRNPQKRQELGGRLQQTVHPDAAARLAALILQYARKK